MIKFNFFTWEYSVFSLKMYLTLSIVCILILLLNYVLRLALILFNVDHDLHIPTNTPKFIQRWLLDINNQIKSEDRKIYISIYLRIIIIYIIVIIFLLFFIISY